MVSVASVRPRHDASARTLGERLSAKIHPWMPKDIAWQLSPLQPADSAFPNRLTKRQREFSAGRSVASELLKTFGVSERVGVNADRSPAWPKGFAGSISHSDHWVWCAVAGRSGYRSVGIDTEPIVDESTAQQLHEQIATETEWQIATIPSLDQCQRFTLIFSAKEAFYKCWYPMTGTVLNPKQIEVCQLDENRITMKRNSDPFQLEIRYLIYGDNVFTATWWREN